MITSTANQQVKHLIQLQNKAKLRDEEGVFVIEGRKMFDELLSDCPERLVTAYFSESFYRESALKHPKLCNEISYEILSDSVFRQACETVTPQGVLAIVKKPHYELQPILFPTKSEGEGLTQDGFPILFPTKSEGEGLTQDGLPPLRLLILENLRDPGNLGTIFRTAEGAGIDGVILNKESVDIYNSKVIRSTMGSIFRVPYVCVEDLHATMKLLRDNGVTLYAAYLSGSKAYDEISYANRSAILIGNEANGLLPETAQLADERIRIPMAGKLESLNAAVAASILMYHTRKHNEL